MSSCSWNLLYTTADNGQASGDSNNRSSSKESKKAEAAAPSSRPPPVYHRSPSVSADPIRSKCVEMLETSLTGDGGKLPGSVDYGKTVELSISRLVLTDELLSHPYPPNPNNVNLWCCVVISFGSDNFLMVNRWLHATACHPDIVCNLF